MKFKKSSGGFKIKWTMFRKRGIVTGVKSSRRYEWINCNAQTRRLAFDRNKREDSIWVRLLGQMAH